MTNRNKRKSFTLIELLVVIVIIGILAGVIMISTSSSIAKANFAKAQTFSNTVQEELLLNLVSEWLFDEDVSPYTTTKDAWGSSNGTVSGAAYKSKGSGECVSGGCYSFNGTSDYINFGNSTNLQWEGSLTYATWIKAISIASSAYFLCDYQTRGAFLYTNVDGRVGMDGRGKIGSIYYQSGVSITSINDHLWHYVVGIWDGTSGINNLKIYVDGKKENANNAPDEASTINSTDFIIGKFSSGYYFNGLMDDVKIYNAALSSSQIKQNYIAGLNSMLSNGTIYKEEYNERINTLAYE